MRWPATTICCSALALTAAIVEPAAAQSDAIPLFPARQQWTLALNNALTAAPGFHGSRAYFPIENDRLVAYDLAAGTQLWLVSSRPLWPPIAADDLVFIVDAEGILALRGDDGAEIWRRPLDERLSVAPVAHSGWLIAATVSGTLHAIGARDGGVRWQHRAGARISAPPALVANRVYVPLEDRRVVAIELDSGEIAWERRIGGAPTGILALDDRIYAGSTDNFLYSFRAGDGDVSWRWRTGADVVGTPVVDDQQLYFLSLDNILRALDPSGGSQKWKRALPFRPRSGPLVAGSTIVVGGLSPSVRGYAAKTGAPSGDVTLPADLVGPPHVFVNGGIPVLVAVTSDIVKGATVVGFIPAAGTPSPFAALPNQPTIPALTLP